MYILQFSKNTTLAATLNIGATSSTLAAGTFGTPAGKQLLVVDYDNASAEVIEATIAGTALSSVTRAKDGTSEVNHASGAKIAMMFAPSHYSNLTNNGVLGYAEITTNFNTAASLTYVDVTGLATAVTVPSGGRRIKITAYTRSMASNQAAANYIKLGVFEGATLLQEAYYAQPVANYQIQPIVIYSGIPTSGSHTYKVAIAAESGNSLTVNAGATYPAYILVEYMGGA